MTRRQWWVKPSACWLSGPTRSCRDLGQRSGHPGRRTIGSRSPRRLWPAQAVAERSPEVPVRVEVPIVATGGRHTEGVPSVPGPRAWLGTGAPANNRVADGRDCSCRVIALATSRVDANERFGCRCRGALGSRANRGPTRRPRFVRALRVQTLRPPNEKTPDKRAPPRGGGCGSPPPTHPHPARSACRGRAVDTLRQQQLQGERRSDRQTPSGARRKCSRSWRRSGRPCQSSTASGRSL